MTQAELSILDSIQMNFRCVFLDMCMPWITALGNGGAVWISITLMLLLIPKTRKTGAAMAIGLVMEAVCCSVILKPLIARPRPCDINTAVHLLIPRPTDYSFPSGHTGASFTCVSALYFEKRKAWIPAFILAILIAFSRMYLYVHYPTDVLAGAILGMIAGFISHRIVNSIQERCVRR